MMLELLADGTGGVGKVKMALGRRLRLTLVVIAGLELKLGGGDMIGGVISTALDICGCRGVGV